MGFWDHLEELRGTIIKSVVVFVVFATVIGIWMQEFNEILMRPLTQLKLDYPAVIIELGTTTIMEGFNVVIQMCVLGGLALSLPFILFFVGQFVSPALTPKELKAVLPLCASALVLFLMGAAFAFSSSCRARSGSPWRSTRCLATPSAGRPGAIIACSRG